MVRLYEAVSFRGADGSFPVQKQTRLDFWVVGVFVLQNPENQKKGEAAVPSDGNNDDTTATLY